jgi:X-X-X-Leu-X-X-Gly heptad repeat protein
MKQRLIVMSVVLLPIVACGGSPEQAAREEAARNIEEGAEAMQQAAEQLADGAAQNAGELGAGMQQLARGFQQMAQGSTTSVDFEQLQALLPTLEGWTQADARGEQLSMPVAYSRAEAVYHRDDSRIELEITDTALNQLLLAPMSMFLASGFSERSSEGYKRSAQIGGQVGFEEWNSESHRGEVTAVVANRFIVTAKGRGLTGLDPVRQAVESVDFAKLTGLE